MMLRQIPGLMLLFIAATFGLQAGESTRASRQLVATANPHASAAGIEMLRRGGSAVDAAIAAELVLTLVEPQSSGIGGGGFIMHFDGTNKLIESYDGRETAPKAIQPDVFLKDDGTPMGYLEAAYGGRPVGVPGMLRLFETVHKQHGKLPWASLFGPAIKLAKNGFNVSPRLHYLLTSYSTRLQKAGIALDDLGTARNYFFDAGGTAWPTGHLLKNPAYAATLELLAQQGADAFYQGPLAEAIIQTVKNAPLAPATITPEDMTGYQVIRRAPVCGAYRAHTLCSMGPPSSGATTVLGILGILEHFDLKAAGVQSAQAVHLFAEASKLAYADREQYLADPAFAVVPTKGLTDPAYLRGRAGLIDPYRAAATVQAGMPQGTDDRLAAHNGHDYPSTSHMVIRDQWGNAVSFTATVQAAFGSFLMTGGFLLNNELTDFAFQPQENGVPVANRAEGGKRPRSSMAPFLVTDADGRLKMAVGSPGGSRIISYVAKTLIGVLDWGLDIQSAIELPNMVNKAGVMELESGKGMERLQADLGKLGHSRVQLRTLNSGLHGLVVHEEGDKTWMTGGADPRREGVVEVD